MTAKVAVLMGGRSLERDISLKSGHRVSDALEEKGYSVIQLDIDENLVDRLRSEYIDLVYIALHGKYGEDGTIQELLEILDIPYTGPGVYSSIVSFDKILSTRIFWMNGIRIPKFFALGKGTLEELGGSKAMKEVIAEIGLPLVVKPSAQGSSLGIKFARQPEEVAEAIVHALSYDQKVILEEYIEGTEISVSVFGNNPPKPLPVVEIVPKKDFFDFESMYTLGMTDYYVPARLAEKKLKEVSDIALKIFNLLQCRDLIRVDMIIGKDSVPYVLENNTSPGMTQTSLVPMAAEASGISFPDLCDQLVQMAMKRSEEEKKKRKKAKGRWNF